MTEDAGRKKMEGRRTGGRNMDGKEWKKEVT